MVVKTNVVLDEGAVPPNVVRKIVELGMAGVVHNNKMERQNGGMERQRKDHALAQE